MHKKKSPKSKFNNVWTACWRSHHGILGERALRGPIQSSTCCRQRGSEPTEIGGLVPFLHQKKNYLYPLCFFHLPFRQAGWISWAFVIQMENADKKGFRSLRSESALIIRQWKEKETYKREQKRKGNKRWAGEPEALFRLPLGTVLPGSWTQEGFQETPERYGMYVLTLGARGIGKELQVRICLSPANIWIAFNLFWLLSFLWLSHELLVFIWDIYFRNKYLGRS